MVSYTRTRKSELGLVGQRLTASCHHGVRVRIENEDGNWFKAVGLVYL